MTPILVGGAEWMHGLGAGPLDICPPHRIHVDECSQAVIIDGKPKVKGVCRNCGYTRMYSPYGEDDPQRWNGDRLCGECGTAFFPRTRTCPSCSGAKGKQGQMRNRKEKSA